MSLEITGTITQIDEIQTFESGFTKREFVITTDEKYPQDVKFELFKESTDKIDKFKVGEAVTVAFNVRGSEWKGRYFVNLNAWKIDAVEIEEKKAVQTGEDDLPF